MLSICPSTVGCELCKSQDFTAWFPGSGKAFENAAFVNKTVNWINTKAERKVRDNSVCVITQSTLGQQYWLHLERTKTKVSSIKLNFGTHNQSLTDSLSFVKDLQRVRCGQGQVMYADVWNNGMTWFKRPLEAFPRANSLGNKDLSAVTQIATRQHLYLTLRRRKTDNTVTKVHTRIISIKSRNSCHPPIPTSTLRGYTAIMVLPTRYLLLSYKYSLERTFLMTFSMFKENNLGVIKIYMTWLVILGHGPTSVCPGLQKS